MSRLRKSFGVVAVALATVLVFAGCANNSQVSDSSNPSVGAPLTSKVGEGVAPGAATDVANSGATASSVIKNASVAVEVSNPVEAGDKVAKIAAKYSGKIDSQSQISNDAGEVWQVILALRVDSKKLETAIDELKALGKLTQVDVSAVDVTVSVLDLEARKKSLVASIARLTTLMQQAKTTSALIEAENMLTQRQGELESIDAQLRYFADQVSLSTINVSLTKKNSGPQAAPQTFVDGLLIGWQSIVAAAAGAVVGIGVALPWMVLVAIVVGAVILVIRVRRRSGE